MPQPLDSNAQEELESLTEAISSGQEPEQILALIAQRACQVLNVAEAHIFLKHGQELTCKASHQTLQETPLHPRLAAGEGIEGWVLKRGRAIALEDAYADRRFRPLADASSHKAGRRGDKALKIAAVPIWASRQVIGVLSVIDFSAPESSASTDAANITSPISGLLPLLSVLADLISLALENTRILAREERRTKLIQLLHYLSSNLPDQMLKEVVQAMEERIGEVMGVQKVEILLYNEETDELVALGINDAGLGRAQQELGLDHLPLGKAGVLADVFRTGQPFLSNDLEQTPTFPAALKEKLGLKAALVAPLEVEQQRRGLICVMSTRQDVFFDEDLAFLLLISNRVSHMVHHQELSRELAQAEAERLDRAERENFLFVVAHDLKNALTTIRGNAQLALRRAARGEAHNNEQALRLIATRSSQAIQLVNDMVDINQMEIGLFRLFMEPVELVELLQEEVASWNETSGEQHRITFHGDLEEVVVEADQTRISQVITNLLNNAIRYSPKGGTIEVILSRATPEAGSTAVADQPAEQGQLPQAVMITINDEGIGLAPEERERIFERSFRGRGATFAPGSGLGLYISREIIERHGGRLWAEPHEGQGSSFRFTLPISRSNLNKPA